MSIRTMRSLSDVCGSEKHENMIHTGSLISGDTWARLTF